MFCSFVTAPYNSRFPYDIQQSPAYELTYLWFCHGTLAAILGTLTTDTLCFGCVMYLSGHFKVVQFQIQSIKTNPKMREEIGQLVRYHKRLIKAFEELNGIASPILLTQFSVASVQLCVVVFQMTLVRSYLHFFIFF